MIKILGSVVLSLIISGCGSTKSISITHKPFQMVKEKDAILVQDNKDKRYCVKCGMDLVRYYKTSHTAEDENRKYQYCSLHCLEEHLGEGIILKNPQVVDISSLKFISISKAYYVVGSSKRGTMSRVSKYAFSSEKEAKNFKALYGGKIMDFNGARKIAQEDFKHYR